MLERVGARSKIKLVAGRSIELKIEQWEILTVGVSTSDPLINLKAYGTNERTVGVYFQGDKIQRCHNGAGMKTK